MNIPSTKTVRTWHFIIQMVITIIVLLTLYLCSYAYKSYNYKGFSLTKLPIIKEKKVHNFYCALNSVTTLEGGGCPEEVIGFFNCGANYLTSLKGGPVKVGDNFVCSINNLTSLEYAPKYVGGDFYCGNNAKVFTEEEVRAVCNVKGKIYTNK